MLFGNILFSSDNAILLADEPGETDTDKVIAIQLRTKELKENIGLETNPDNYNKRIRFLGLKRKYLEKYHQQHHDS